jgi:hypothetical protein
LSLPVTTEILLSVSLLKLCWVSDRDERISDLKLNTDPGTSDIADASDTVGQDFDRSDISIHEAQPALRRTARVSKVPQRFDDFILYR